MSEGKEIIVIVKMEKKKKYDKYLMWKCYGNDGILCVIVMLLR